jgi:hypothetical protein
MESVKLSGKFRLFVGVRSQASLYAAHTAASIMNTSGRMKAAHDALHSPNACYAAAGRQFTRNTPTTHTAMPTSASGASLSPNSAKAINAVTGGVR